MQQSAAQPGFETPSTDGCVDDVFVTSFRGNNNGSDANVKKEGFDSLIGLHYFLFGVGVFFRIGRKRRPGPVSIYDFTEVFVNFRNLDFRKLDFFQKRISTAKARPQLPKLNEVIFFESKNPNQANNVVMKAPNQISAGSFRQKILCSLAIVFMAIPATQAADPAEAKTIGRFVREQADLSGFLQLLEKTETGSLLSEKTNVRFTVFAPTDAAIAKLPEGAIETLLDPKNDDRLEEVFGFHVLGRAEPAFALEKYSLLQMTTRQFLEIDYKAGKVGNATLSGRVIPCSNGIVYVIDDVLMPNTDDLFQRLQKDGRFKIFTRAITASRQGKLFQNMHSRYTVFAPTDDAFGKLPADFLESLFLPENDERLEDIIKHHITEGIFAAGKVPSYSSLGVTEITPISAFGQQLNFKVRDGKPSIDDATVLETDLPSANGVIHVVDSVLSLAEESVMDLLKKEEKYSTLVKLLQVTSLDTAVASSSQFTVFAPSNAAWEKSPYQAWINDPTGENREKLYGLISRHVITGKHISENPLPFNKLRTIHDAPIYLLREDGQSTISGLNIVETDREAFNGLVNEIDGVITDGLELPEGDISGVDAIKFLQDSLEQGKTIYEEGSPEKTWRFFHKQGYEFLSKYSEFIDKDNNRAFRTAIRDDQPVYRFSAEAWDSRNAFRNLLRKIEQSEDRLLDQFLMQRPAEKRFGR